MNEALEAAASALREIAPPVRDGVECIGYVALVLLSDGTMRATSHRRRGGGSPVQRAAQQAAHGVTQSLVDMVRPAPGANGAAMEPAA